MYLSRFLILLILIRLNNVKLFELIDENKKLIGNPPILLNNYNKQYKIKEKEQIKLKCPIDMILSQNSNLNDDYDYNNNLIIINWFDNTNEKILSSFLNDQRFKIDNDIYLIIKDVNKNDQGIYRCEANNGFGTISVNLTLEVYSMYRFILIIFF